MALTYSLKSHSYEGRHMVLDCVQTKNIGDNTSTIDWTLTVKGGSSNYYTTGPTTVKINGIQVYYKAKTYWTSYEFPAAKGSTSGSLIVNHDINGDAEIEVSIKTNIYNGVLVTSNGTWTLDSNERFATITSAPNFNDEENPTLVYSNPAGENVDILRACISLNGDNADITYRDISKTGTSYTFNLTEAERDVLRAATTGKNSRTVSFHVYTLIGSNDNYASVDRTFTIKNPDPILNPSIVDINPTTIALTGDNKRLVRYVSNAQITFGASAVKKAVITSKQVTCGDHTLNSDGVIYPVTTNSFRFRVTDNRNNTVDKTYTSSDTNPIYSFVNYIKPTCSLLNNMPDADGDMTVTVTGSYFNNTFGKEYNALNVYYRYKVAGSKFTDSDKWILMDIDPTDLTDNTYTATANVKGLDYQTAYTFQAYARDVITTTNTQEITVKSTPIFDWGERDFKFNVTVYDEFNTVIRNGKAAYTGSGIDAIDPNTTTEELCLTDHANGPKPGYWFFIRTMLFGEDLDTTAYRSQTASPAGAPLSEYHRYYTSSSGWSEWRRHLNEDENYMQSKTLWVNASTTSSFGNQTIAVDLTDYDLVLVEFLTNCSTGAWQSYRITMTVPVNHDSGWKNYKAVGFGSNGSDIAFRAFHMGNNNIKFGDSYYASSYATSSLTVNNNLYIPLRIYGIKGVT